nr:MAG TPA: hypothetical protein [Caudoviricetes sp.]
MAFISFLYIAFFIVFICYICNLFCSVICYFVS